MSTSSLLDKLLTLLFPDRCAGCMRLGGLFCQYCRAKLAPYPGSLPRRPASLADVRIVFIYQSPLREAVHQLKYRRQRRMAAPLGALLAEHLAQRPLAADAVLAVPLHAERLAERGFNQAYALAREVAAAARLPLITDGLTRVRATGKQAMLDARAREENMRGAFRWQSHSAPPRRIILVDDILTTGATMAASAEALRAAGAAAVYGLALARSRPDLDARKT